MIARSALALVAAQLLAAPLAAQTPVAAAATTSPQAAIDAATALARWQLTKMNDAATVSRATSETRNPRAWEQGVFWAAMTVLADAGDRYRVPADIKQAILAMGRANGWQPGARNSAVRASHDRHNLYSSRLDNRLVA